MPGTSPGMTGEWSGLGTTEGLTDARMAGTSPGKSGHDVDKSTRAGRAMRKHRAGAWEFLE